MIPNINLDQVRTDDLFNFTKQFVDDAPADNIYDQSQDLVSTCDYYDSQTFRELEQVNPNSHSYFHLNCRSLSANWESFKELIDEINSDNFAFDVIGISELFNCEKDKRINLEGYQFVKSNRKHSCRGL